MKKKNIKRIIIIVLILASLGISSYAVDYLLNATQVSYNNGTTNVTVQSAINDLYDKATVLDTIRTNSNASSADTRTFTRGSEITYNGDAYFILNDVSSTDITVEILKKTNSHGNCAFSSRQYWTESNANLNLDYRNAETDALGIARSYAKSKGAINGRLLTYSEANSLQGSYGDMIYGNSKYGKQNYWLGSANGGYYSVWVVRGFNGTLGYVNCSDSGIAYGVRPVITIFKSQIT